MLRTLRPDLCARLTLLSLVSAIPVLITTPVLAQNAAPAPKGSRAGTRSLETVLARLSQSAGVIAVADSAVSREVVSLPSTAATPETVEQQLDALVKALPAGTTWVKLYLPAPANGRLWNGDDVAAYALAQARLYGAMGAAPKGTVEILGQRLPEQKAREHILALNLKLVYLVTNPARRFVGRGDGVPWSPITRQQWSQMPRQQQKEYGQRQAEQIMALPPPMRQQMIEQMKQEVGMFDTVKDSLEKLLGQGF